VSDDLLAEDPSCTYEPAGDASLVTVGRAVTYGMPASRALRWTPEAEARLARIPSFVRGVVARRLEDFARARGADEVTAELMGEVRRAMPVDFSRKRPFFLDEE
jgi:AdoMet-dependent heme synthase